MVPPPSSMCCMQVRSLSELAESDHLRRIERSGGAAAGGGDVSELANIPGGEGKGGAEKKGALGQWGRCPDCYLSVAEISVGSRPKRPGSEY